MAPLVVEFNEERVHELYPEASMVPAQKMWALPKGKRDRAAEFADNGDYLASKKIDGYCYQLNRTENHVYFFSRSKGVNGLLSEKIDRVPHIQSVAWDLPVETLLVGEIYVPGGKSNDVTRIMGSLAPKAIARQKAEGYLHYYIVDVVMWDGVDMRDVPFEQRAEKLLEIEKDYFDNDPYIHVAHQISENIYETAMNWIAAGEEGAVLRKKDSKYIPGNAKAWQSIKIKPEETLDVVITDFQDPTKEYTGTSIESWEYWVMEREREKLYQEDWVEVERWIGKHKAIRSPEYRTIPVTKAYYYGWKNAVTIAAYNDLGALEPIGTISSGLTDAIREDMAKFPENYRNKVIEVKAMSLDSKAHTLRHGKFIRFRDDKEPQECLIKDIFK